MEQVGKAFVLDYGDFVVKVRYLSESRLGWEQMKGPEVGRTGEESYRVVAVRPKVYLIWWQEKDTSVISQVVDFEGGKVNTLWISPDNEVAHFQGTIRPAER